MIDRRWNVAPTTQPTSPVTVCSYFTEQEYQDLVDTLANHNNGAAGYAYLITDPTVMSMYKINSNTPYLSPHDAGISGVILSNSSSPTNTTWVYDSLEDAHVAEFQVSSFSGGGGGNGGGTGALPVDLIEFDAVAIGPQVAQLNWATASELNNSHFVIERSYDAQNFEEVGIVQGNGNSNETLDYSYTDNTIDNGISIVYYRLRQVDYDGQNELSVFRNLNFDKLKVSEHVLVYPNPFINLVNVNIANKNVKRFSIAISSLNGTEVYLDNQYDNTGTVTIDLSKYKAGVYVLAITTKNEVNYVKITKI